MMDSFSKIMVKFGNKIPRGKLPYELVAYETRRKCLIKLSIKTAPPPPPHPPLKTGMVKNYSPQCRWLAVDIYRAAKR